MYNLLIIVSFILGFKGCIKVLKYNNQVMPFTGSNDLVEVQPSDVSVQIGCSGWNLCPNGTKCIDLWLAYKCLPLSCFPDPCTHGGTCIISLEGLPHCKPDFTGSYCELPRQKGNVQFPQWRTAIIILVTLGVISLLVAFFKCRYTTSESKRTKMGPLFRQGTVNKAFDDDHISGCDIKGHTSDDNGKPPDIIKAEKNRHAVDETFSNATGTMQKKNNCGHKDYDIESYATENTGWVAPLGTDDTQHQKPIRTINDQDHKVIPSRNGQSFTSTLNHRNTHSTTQITSSQQNATTIHHENQHCLHVHPSQWFHSSFLLTEHQHFMNELHSTGYGAEVSPQVHFDDCQSSQGGIDNLSFSGDLQPDTLTFASNGTTNSRGKQALRRFPMGLSAEEVKKLHAPTLQKPVESTIQETSLSQFSQRISSRRCASVFIPTSDPSSDSDSHSSFTCSEYDYERELYSNFSVDESTQRDSGRCIVEDDEVLDKWEIGLKRHATNLLLMDSQIISDEDSDNNILPTTHDNTIYKWETFLNWGPTFEMYLDIFKDLAELPIEPGIENQCCAPEGSDHEEIL